MVSNILSGGLNSAKSLHDEMLVQVFHSPMSFFDTTPIGNASNLMPRLCTYIYVGRVLNRFSKDQNAIDEQLFMAVSYCLSSSASRVPLTSEVFMFLNQTFQAVGTVIVVSSVTPFFVAFLIPLGT